MNEITISIPSLTENIRIVESFIDNAKEKLQINDDIYGNIMIAITESVNNAIIHGNAADKSKNVKLSCAIEDNVVVFYVTDEGSGFDYNSLPDPTAPENIDKPGGRGIFLMKALCDELQFQEEGRKVKLSFYVD
ncbi:ATP-binding protein [Marivirga sp. S37H4]|uniref:ATP-binding protein n=1 Tax=Marivirga aurantiaca TaxID=2802615 RepID=A0A935CDQ1_9BACT|nr:ATP-binding protein [Marivirga aurantiaca]MBK6267148.1 ATP-binding protein [Marivirga aurantiaca]